TFELFHSISDDSRKRCPKCRSIATRVPAGGSGLLFKGSGFYITDYRSSGYKASAKQETSGKSEKAPAPASGASGGGSAGASHGPSADSSSSSSGPASPASSSGASARPSGRPSQGSSGRSSDRSSGRSSDRSSGRS